MFSNECLDPLAYEATAAAIFMAGIFLSFLVEYLGLQMILRRNNAATSPSATTGTVEGIEAQSSNPHGDKHGFRTQIQRVGSIGEDPIAQLRVVVMETGIIFHSISTPSPPKPVESGFHACSYLPRSHSAKFSHSHRRHPRRRQRPFLYDPRRDHLIPPSLRGNRARLAHRSPGP